MAAELCSYAKGTDLYILKGWILWSLNYISISKWCFKEQSQTYKTNYKIESLNKEVEDIKKNQVEILELKNKTEAKTEWMGSGE